jgi:hypothetical protein
MLKTVLWSAGLGIVTLLTACREETPVSSVPPSASLSTVEVSPTPVTQGNSPEISVSITNTTSTEARDGGAVTLLVRAKISRGGNTVSQQEWREAFGPGERKTGFLLPPNFDTGQLGSYSVLYEVYSDDGRTQLDSEQTAFTVVQSIGPACNVPSEPNQKQSYLAFWRAPYGFAGATPWLNVLHDTRQSGSSVVEIDYIRLWARIGGVSQPVASNEYNTNKFGGQLCARTPWYGGPCSNMPGSISNGVLTIRPSDFGNHVWHPYLESWPDPRFNIGQADSVWIETRFRISGPAMVQAGLDYWQYVDYPSSNRIEEAGATDWHCSQGVWQTVGLERGTEVVGSIQLANPSGGAQLRAGESVTGTFTVTNFDAETVRLAEIGIETRLLASGDSYCDYTRSQRVEAFSWRLNVDLAPGASMRHSTKWTPPSAGTYCVTIVQKQRDSSTYRKTYLRQGTQVVTVS